MPPLTQQDQKNVRYTMAFVMNQKIHYLNQRIKQGDQLAVKEKAKALEIKEYLERLLTYGY